MMQHFQILLAGAVACPDSNVAALPWLRRAEEHQLLVDWNDTGADEMPARCLHEVVLSQAARTPQAAAVVSGSSGAVLTYGDLDRRSAALAAYLRTLGVGPEVRVGLCMPRTPDLIIALLGVLRAGGAYVPIDPSYPVERQAFMIEDADIAVVLTHSRVAETLCTATQSISLDQLIVPDSTSSVPKQQGHPPESLAYVIYTSGSTGRPKGVAIRHGAAVAMIRWAHQVFSHAELARVLASTSICFDLSVFEIFAPLSCGGTVILAEHALELPALASCGVTLINIVPSVMSELLRPGALPETARTVNFAGEPLSLELVNRVYGAGTVHRVFNLYGPSEDTTYSTWAEVPPGATRVTIGRPLEGTYAWVLDSSLRPVPIGVTGELCLAGQGLARGYLHRPAHTAERFLPNQFAREPGDRLYRTGDLARQLPDGRFVFIGRLDQQVKVRGFRIEPREIEIVLNSHPSVRESIVLIREIESQDLLVAYVVPEGQFSATTELMRFLEKQLPSYMIPANLIWLEAFPLTPNGKIDRAALPIPTEITSLTPFVPPRTPSEQVVADIWAQILGLERVGVLDNFFKLGA